MNIIRKWNLHYEKIPTTDETIISTSLKLKRASPHPITSCEIWIQTRIVELVKDLLQGLIFCKIRYIDENFPMIMAEFILHKNHKCCKPIGTYKFIKLLKFLAPMALKNSTIRPKVGKFLGNLFNWIHTTLMCQLNESTRLSF